MTDPEVTPPIPVEPADPPAPAPEPPAPADHWTDGFRDELRTNTTLRQHDSAEALASTYLEQQHLIGRKGVIKPGEDGTDDQWSTYFNELGRPEDVTGYEMPAVPEGVAVDEAFVSSMMTTMHAAGLSNEQAAAIFTAYTGLQGSATSAAQTTSTQAHEQASEQLHSEWGNAYDENVLNANKIGLMMFGGNQAAFDAFMATPLQDGSVLGDSAVLTRALASGGKLLSEDALTGAETTSYSRTPEQAKSDLVRFESDEVMQAALTDQFDPQHGVAVAMQDKLYREVYPGEESRGH